MMRGTRILIWLLCLGAVGTLTIQSCADKSMSGVDGYDQVINDWSAHRIEGALDAQGNLLDTVTGEMSMLTFHEDRTYTWYLHAQPYFVIDGEGRYSVLPSYSGEESVIYLDGIIPATLGVHTIAFRPEGDSLTFLDEDSDRWTYIR